MISNNKTIIDTYILHRRWMASGIDISDGNVITLLSDDEVSKIEDAIKAATPSMSPLERYALQGRLDGLSGEQIARASGYHVITVYQAIASAIAKINFSGLNVRK